MLSQYLPLALASVSLPLLVDNSDYRAEADDSGMMLLADDSGGLLLTDNTGGLLLADHSSWLLLGNTHFYSPVARQCPHALKHHAVTYQFGTVTWPMFCSMHSFP